MNRGCWDLDTVEKKSSSVGTFRKRDRITFALAFVLFVLRGAFLPPPPSRRTRAETPQWGGWARNLRTATRILAVNFCRVEILS